MSRLVALLWLVGGPLRIQISHVVLPAHRSIVVPPVVDRVAVRRGLELVVQVAQLVSQRMTSYCEATCKSLVEARMCRSGARWRPDTAQALLSLRALALSDRWDSAITLTLAPLRREVRRAA